MLDATGPHPGFHEEAKRRLRSEWPSLAAALDEATAHQAD
jgi:hypothetical protein